MKANGNRVVTRGNSDATEQIRKTRMPPNTSHLFAKMLVKRLTLPYVHNDCDCKTSSSIAFFEQSKCMCEKDKSIELSDGQD